MRGAPFLFRAVSVPEWETFTPLQRWGTLEQVFGAIVVINTTVNICLADETLVRWRWHILCVQERQGEVT